VQTENRSKKKKMFAGKQHSQQQHPKLLNSTSSMEHIISYFFMGHRHRFTTTPC